MKRNSSVEEEEKLNKRRQLEENRRSTKNAIATRMQTSSIGLSLAKNKQPNNELITVLEPHKVGNFFSD